MIYCPCIVQVEKKFQYKGLDCNYSSAKLLANEFLISLVAMFPWSRFVYRYGSLSLKSRSQSRQSAT